MLSQIRTYLIFFLILFSASLFFNIISFKKYNLYFIVYSNNISSIDSIIHNEKNLSHPLFSSLYYSRYTAGKFKVGLRTNNLQESNVFLEKIREDFKQQTISKLKKVYINSNYFLDSFDTNVKYDPKRIQELIVNNQLLLKDKETELLNSLSTDLDLENLNKQFKERLSEVYKISDKDIENMDTLLKYLVYFISNEGVGEISIDINRNQLISLNEIIISVLFSLIFMITYFSIKKNN